MAVFYSRKIAAQQAGAFLNVALGHAFLQPVVSNGLADVYGGEHDKDACIVITSESSGKRKLVPCAKLPLDKPAACDLHCVHVIICAIAHAATISWISEVSGV